MGLFGDIGNVVLGGLNLANQVNEQRYQRGVDQRNFDFQREQYDYNKAFQREQYEYNKGLQQTQFEREDSAVQRRMADLEAAGMNPLLAAGQSANSVSSPISSTLSHTGGVSSGSFAPQYNSQFPDVVSGVMTLLKQKADIDSTLANQQYVSEQIENARVDRAATILNTLQRQQSFPLEQTKRELSNKQSSVDIERSKVGLSQDESELSAYLRDQAIIRSLGIMTDTPPGLVGLSASGMASFAQSAGVWANAGKQLLNQAGVGLKSFGSSVMPGLESAGTSIKAGLKQGTQSNSDRKAASAAQARR
ncbi:MAG: hypothetical protein LBC53_09230 [Spirochaetaceae bacterium]|jgi:hypothetical protein|nr:hypothetical protein [Spirochaetaceae bacterium]